MQNVLFIDGRNDCSNRESSDEENLLAKNFV